MLQLRAGLYVEQRLLSPLPWAAVYLLSGSFGTLASCLAQPSQISVGASGALMGILGAWCVFLCAEWGLGTDQAHQQRRAELTVVIVAVALTLAFSALPNIGE